jgi:hypothetical protein
MRMDMRRTNLRCQPPLDQRPLQVENRRSAEAGAAAAAAVADAAMDGATDAAMDVNEFSLAWPLPWWRPRLRRQFRGKTCPDLSRSRGLRDTSPSFFPESRFPSTAD